MTAHLTGDVHLGLYPLLDGDRCWWLAADFDGDAAMLDALAYLKAARALSVPAALEVSRSGVGAHVWLFFTAPVPAEAARGLGSGLLREAMALRGRMDLASYDRLFPSQDVLPAGGVGNLIAAPLNGRSRADGATVFLDAATLEPHEDQWAYLSTLSRMTPREVTRLAERAGTVKAGIGVDRIAVPASTRTRPALPAVLGVRLGGGVRLEAAQLTPALLATLKHAASMANPVFSERQRMRLSTWDVPRFLRSYDETLDGGLILPRGLLDTVRSLVEQAGSRMEVTDERVEGTPQEFTFAADLSTDQHAAVASLREHDQGVLVAPPGASKTVMAAAPTGPPRWCWSTVRRWPINGAPASANCWGSSRASSVVGAARPAAPSTSRCCRPWPAATTSPTPPAVTGSSWSMSAITCPPRPTSM